MTDKRERGAGFWAAVAAAVVLAYPLLLGPCCWISSRTGSGASVVSAAYRPLFRPSPILDYGDYERSPLLRVLTFYSELGAPDDWSWGPHNLVVEDTRANSSSPYVFRVIGVWSWERWAGSR